MGANLFLRVFAGLSLGFSVMAFAWRLRVFNRLARPVDRATPKGSLRSGLAYAYTLGMAPWAKESTRRHWLSYMRGVAFHLGIFLGLAVLVASPCLSSLSGTWKSMLALFVGLGAIFGLAGLAARFAEPNLRALSTIDDLFSVLLVSLFLGTEALWLLYPAALGLFYLASAAMLIYAPFSKIRHCIYFAYSRLFYGKYIGSRAILPHSQQKQVSGVSR